MAEGGLASQARRPPLSGISELCTSSARAEFWSDCFKSTSAIFKLNVSL